MKNDPSDPSTQALVPVTKQYPALMEGFDLVKVFNSNFGGNTLQISDLDRITTPKGITVFTVESPEGDEIVKEIEGIILFVKSGRQYYEHDFGSTEGGPPDCESDDLVSGSKFGPCKGCEYGQWGSGKNAVGQACKQKINVFLIGTRGLLPFILSIATGSVRDFNKYLLRLTNQGLPFSTVITKFVAVKDTSKGGYEYSRVVPTMVRKLTDVELQSLPRVYEAFNSLFKTPASAPAQPSTEEVPF